MKKQKNKKQWLKAVVVAAAVAVAVVPSVLFSACGSKQPTTPVTPVHQHECVTVAVEHGTVTHDGVLMHYQCTGCGKLLRNIYDTTPTDAADLVIYHSVVGAWQCHDITLTTTDDDGEAITVTTADYLAMDDSNPYKRPMRDMVMDSAMSLRADGSAVVLSYVDDDTCWSQDGNTITVELPNKGMTFVYTIDADGYLVWTKTAGKYIITAQLGLYGNF